MSKKCFILGSVLECARQDVEKKLDPPLCSQKCKTNSKEHPVNNCVLFTIRRGITATLYILCVLFADEG